MYHNRDNSKYNKRAAEIEMNVPPFHEWDSIKLSTHLFNNKIPVDLHAIPAQSAQLPLRRHLTAFQNSYFTIMQGIHAERIQIILLMA